MVTLLGMLWLFKGLSAKTKQWEQKSLQAHQLNETVHIDGVLNEGVWQNGGAGDFTQSEPMDGAPATEKTTVGWGLTIMPFISRPGCQTPNRIKLSGFWAGEMTGWIRIGLYLLLIPIMTAAAGINLQLTLPVQLWI